MAKTQGILLLKPSTACRLFLCRVQIGSFAVLAITLDGETTVAVITGFALLVVLVLVALFCCHVETPYHLKKKQHRMLAVFATCKHPTKSGIIQTINYNVRNAAMGFFTTQVLQHLNRSSPPSQSANGIPFAVGVSCLPDTKLIGV